MRSIEDKGCYHYGSNQEFSSSNGVSFEFHKGDGKNRISHHRTALGFPTPSKWDDAQKWLVGLSRKGDKAQSHTTPRNSNADDRRLIAPVPHKDTGYSSGEDDIKRDSSLGLPPGATQHDVETKKVDSEEPIWRINKPTQKLTTPIRSVCVRDMGTEMTPIGSQEPSRTATPIRVMTPARRSPIGSDPSTPTRCQHGSHPFESHPVGPTTVESIGEPTPSDRATACVASEIKNMDQARKLSPLETRAMAWDEAERAKYMARFKREEVKIQAWENHEKRKAEMEMKRMEIKAERLKARAQEKYANKLAATRRIAEEKRANAEAKLNEKAVRTSETADYIRRTGHLPSSFSFKLPSICW